jgi:hypothetical protein
MPFSLQYKRFIEKEDSVSKILVRPKNIYKIVYYEYADGTVKTLSGPKTSYVFVIGIYDKKLVCLKISEIRPDKFFLWLKSIFQKSLTNERIDESKRLDEIIIRSDRNGSTLYNRYVSGKPILTQSKNPYRTYNMDGIRQISEIIINKDTLKEYLNK